MERFGRLILEYRWVWLAAIVAVSVVLLMNVPSLDMEDDETTWYPEGDATLETFRDFEDRFEGEDFIVVAYAWDEPFSSEALTTLAELTDLFEREVPYVAEATSLTNVDDIAGTTTTLEVRPLIDPNASPSVDVDQLRHRIAINPLLRGNLISEDETVVAIVLELQIVGQNEEEAGSEAVARLHAVLDEQEARTGLRFHAGGGRITETQTERMLETDIARFFPLTMILTGALLLLFLRRISSVVLPLTTVFLSLGWTLGLKVVVGSPITPVSTTLFALITVIGVANSVHILSHFEQEKGKSGTRAEALLRTYRRAGRPCLMTSLTTAVGFASLIISPIPAIKNLGAFAAFGILSAFVLSMVLVPLGIDLFGRRSRRIVRNRWLERILDRIAQIDLRFPRWVLVASVAVVAIMAVGITAIEPAGSLVEHFRHNSRIRTAIDFIDANLSGVSSTEIVLYGERDAFKEPENLAKLGGLREIALRRLDVATVYSLTDTVKLIGRALHNDDPAYYAVPATRASVSQSLLLYEMSGGTGLRDYVSGDYAVARVSIRTRQMSHRAKEDLLADITTYVEAALPDFRAEVTGMDFMVNELNRRVVATQIQSFGLAIGVITLMMILVFGWRAGLVSLLPNALPIVFVLGLMGYAGFRLNIATAIIASIAIGIVVDDTIHFFSHFRDELARTGDPKLAVKGALSSVGKALCFTTAILLAGFGVFLFSESWILASYGMLSGTAVAVALAGDLLLGPVLLSRLPLFGPRKPRSPARHP